MQEFSKKERKVATHTINEKYTAVVKKKLANSKRLSIFIFFRIFSIFISRRIKLRVK